MTPGVSESEVTAYDLSLMLPQIICSESHVLFINMARRPVVRTLWATAQSQGTNKLNCYNL
jgi:hypothetical protein